MFYKYVLFVLFTFGVYLPEKVMSASVSDLLGELDAIQCYHNDSKSIHCINLQTGESWKVTERSKTWENWTGGINRDGTKLAYEDNHQAMVINLNGTHRQVIAETGTYAHFWRDEDGKDWIVYNGEKTSKGMDGTTWRVQINPVTNEPLEGTRKKLADLQWTARMGGSGVYLGESYGGTKILNLKTGKSTPNKSLNETQNCVGSMHPGDKPWLMFEENTGHKSVVIYAWDEEDDSVRRIWRHKGYGMFSQWSCSHENYATILKTSRNAGEPASLQLIKLEVDVSGSGDNDGDTQTADMPEAKGMVGGVWVGELDNNTTWLQPGFSPRQSSKQGLILNTGDFVTPLIWGRNIKGRKALNL